MSMDYPFYEELCRRKHPAAWWWIIGDRMYYLGLLIAPIMLVLFLIKVVQFVLGQSETSSVAFLGAAIVAVAVFFLGAVFKRRAYTEARRDGIDGSDF